MQFTFTQKSPQAAARKVINFQATASADQLLLLHKNVARSSLNSNHPLLGPYIKLCWLCLRNEREIISCKALILHVPWIPWDLWVTARLNSAANRTTCWVEVAVSQWCLLDRLSVKFDSPWATSWRKCNVAKPIKADGGLHGPVTLLYVSKYCATQNNNNNSYTSGAAQWALRSRCDKNEGCHHLRWSYSQGQVCQLKCATVADWQHRESHRMDGCFTLIENQ